MNAAYHSRHGAIQESQHVYIKEGLSQLPGNHVSVLEMGFGSGLNSLLTLMHSEVPGSPSIYYEAIENIPIPPELASQLNYCTQLNRADLQPAFMSLHHSPWNILTPITPKFTLMKQLRDMRTIQPELPFQLVYFDAFDPATQPELWTTEIFFTIRKHMTQGGILVTYCSKSSVQRALREAGFDVKKVPGPHGKREIIRAYAR